MNKIDNIIPNGPKEASECSGDQSNNRKLIGKSSRRINLSHYVIVKSPGLLPMNYKVSELAEELKINSRTLRDWLEYGAPHTRDQDNHIWINGVEFSEWVVKVKKKKTALKMSENQGRCFKCRKIVEIVNPKLSDVTGVVVCISGECSNCGSKVYTRKHSARLTCTMPNLDHVSS